MNLKEDQDKIFDILEVVNSLEITLTSEKEFETKVEHVGKDFAVISFNAKDKDQKSFSILILPKLEDPLAVKELLGGEL